MPDSQSTNGWLLLLEGVLDWPFLLFVIIIFCSLFFRQQLGGLLSRWDIAIDWGTGSIRLRELSEKFDQEVDPVREELDALKQAVTALESQTGHGRWVMSLRRPLHRQQTKRSDVLPKRWHHQSSSGVAFRGSRRWQRSRNQPCAMYSAPIRRSSSAPTSQETNWPGFGAAFDRMVDNRSRPPAAALVAAAGWVRSNALSRGRRGVPSVQESTSQGAPSRGELLGRRTQVGLELTAPVRDDASAADLHERVAIMIE